MTRTDIKRYTTLAFILISSLTSFNLCGQTLVSGAINENTRWSLAGSPYIITSNTVVFGTNTLTIDPGVIVKFENNVQLRIQGSLIATGTKSDSIIFTSNSANPTKSSWQEISLEFQAKCILEYVKLEYAKNALKYNLIATESSFRNTLFQNNDIAISVDSGRGQWPITMTSVVFRNNNSGIFSFHDEVTMNYCQFINNGIGASVVESNVNHCIFQGNAVIGLTGHTSTIKNSTFSGNNVGLEQSFSGGSDASVMTNNVITNNRIGLNITGNLPRAVFSNNLICNNASWNIYNNSTYSGHDLSNNCWCDKSTLEIDNSIYDGLDNINVGVVNYSPISTTCPVNTSASICVDNNGYDFGSNTLSESGFYVDTLKAQDASDSVVVLNLETYNSVEEQVNISICEGETYIFGTQTITSAGDYTEVFDIEAECDSTVILTVDINPIYQETISATVCEGDSYEFGTQSLTSAGEYTEIFQSQAACDSTVVLTLNVTSNSTQTTSTTICEDESYEFGSQILTTAGEYVEVFQSEAACDSTVVLTLTVDQSIKETTSVDICKGDVYEFGSQTLTETGEYSEVFQSDTACDSTVVIALTVHPEINETTSVTICEGDSYEFGSQSLTEAGEYTEVFQSEKACDSTVVITLLVEPDINQSVSATICEGDSFEFGAQSLTIEGNYTETFQSKTACDSSVALTLNVLPKIEETIVAEICTGEVFNFGSQLLTAEGEYTKKFQSTDGCDSTVALTLNLIPIIKTNASETICEGDTYELGSQLLNESGEYEEVFTSSSGCDSIVSLTLSVDCILNAPLKEASNNISIFPNPSSKNIKIDFSRRFSGDLILADLSGKLILIQQVDHLEQTEMKLNVPVGTYYLTIRDDNGNISHHPIIKR